MEPLSSNSQQHDDDVDDDTSKSRYTFDANVVKKQQGLNGIELFEYIASRTVRLKEETRQNRCPNCWHDLKLMCICSHLPSILDDVTTIVQQERMTPPSSTSTSTHTTEQVEDDDRHEKQSRRTSILPIKVLLMMHYKEYMSAGNDAKLLLKMLPKDNIQLYIFGKYGDWEKFEKECQIDPQHTLTLWPNEDSITVDEFISNHIPENSPWKDYYNSKNNDKKNATSKDINDNFTGLLHSLSKQQQQQPLPTIRVIVLDGVYSHARTMFRTLSKRLQPQHVPVHVALHPETVSIYHRAQNSYAQSSAITIQKRNKHSEAFHICTVEAFALLMKELKLDEPKNESKKKKKKAEMTTTTISTNDSVDDDDVDNDEDISQPTTASWTEKLVMAVLINNKALEKSHDVRPPRTPRTKTTTSQSSSSSST